VSSVSYGYPTFCIENQNGIKIEILTTTNTKNKKMMLIEPKWFKKNKCQIFKKSTSFFLTDFGLQDNTTHFYKTGASANGVEIVPISSVAKRVVKESNTINCIEKQKRFFLNSKLLQQIDRSLFTFSFLCNKPGNPSSWKTISVHPFQKIDWSIRSENNTGFYSTEILQTTTI
jgi:hypothetical protein